MKRRGKQLSFPLPRPTAAERKAHIRERLRGYEFRQAAREAKRAAARRRRKLRSEAGQGQPREPFEQLAIPTIRPGEGG